MDREIQVGTDYTFDWTIYHNALAIVPTSATVSIYDYSGSTVIDGAAVSISAAGKMSYTFLAADNDTIGKNYKLVLSYTADGIDYARAYLFDVVYHPLKNLVSDYDLYDHLPEMRDSASEYKGKATSDGSTTTIIDVGLYNSRVDYTGGTAQVFASESVGYHRRIDAYSYETGTITLDEALPTATTTGMRYSMRASYQSLIDRAFEIVRKDVRRKVGQSSKYIDGSVIKDAVIYKALYLHTFAAVQQDGDRYSIMSTRFDADYNSAILSINEPVDTDGDGNISADEDAKRPNAYSLELTV